ncbi:MAG: kelch repeat-containing protein, partial [Ekhidna sp.]
MKKSLNLLFLLLCISAAAQTPTYKWVSGSQIQREKSSLVLTSPGARNGASSFTDNDGNYYVFGGFGNDFSQTQGFFNDLWKYERNTATWTWIDGQISADKEVPGYNNSLSFDGVDDKVVLDSNPIEYDQSFTIELWFKTNSDGALISSSPDDMASVSQGWSLDIEGNNIHVKKFYGDNIASFSTNNITDDQWHHLAFKFDPGDDLFVNESISIFIDGEIVGNRDVDFRNELDPNDDHVTIIGSSQGNGNESFFNGQLDEIRFWNYARNGAEIKSSRTIELSGKEAGLASYYNFNQGIAGSSSNTESTLLDIVSNNNGTLSDNIYRPSVFIGEMANTRVWSSALNDNEVKTASQMEATGSETNLEMAFDFNTGTADGDNTSETLIPDLTGVNDGFFNNFDLTGENSNLVEGVLKVSPQIYLSENDGEAVVAADLNNDTYDDIITSNWNPQSINVFINDQSGNLNTPVSLPVGSFAKDLTVGFWNDDSFPDIAVAAGGVTLGDEKVRIFFGDGLGGFSSTLDLPFPANSEPNEVRAADINGDTHDDLIVLLGGEDRIEIHYGDGLGAFPSSYTFDLIGEHYNKGLLIDDFTNDGYLDIATSVILNGNCPEIGFHENDETGEFLTGTYFPISGCIAISEILSEDFNGDGNMDFIYYDGNNIGSIIGNGDGTFREGEDLYREQTDHNFTAFALSDINSDGITDMVLTSDNQILLFEGDGTGKFEESSQVNINFATDDIISSDLDKNGSVDFIVCHGWDRVTVVKREADGFDRSTSSRTLNFDGVDDHINVPNLKVFDNSFTFESWIKTEDNGPLFSFTDQDQFAEWNSGQFSIVIKEGRLTFMVNGFDDIQANNEYNLTNGEWHHVAVVVYINSGVGENDGVQFFIDGIEDGNFYDYDFNEQIDNANGSFHTKLGFATGDFSNFLGSTGISPESNWVDGVIFPESNSGRSYAAEWSDGENFYVFGGQGIDGIYNSLLRYSLTPNECPDLTGVTYTFNSTDAYADFGALEDQTGSGIIQSGSSNGSYVYTDISFGILQGGYGAGDGVGPELNSLCEDPFYSGNDQYGIAYTIISSITRSEDGSSITFSWSNDYSTGMGATTTITLDDGVWPEFETGSWPLISGSEIPGDLGNYGLQNVSEPSNLPPARYALNATVGINNDVWIFGGAANEGPTEWFNDMWKYDPLTNEWLWVSGEESVNGLAVYGSKGVSSSSNIPGPRSNHTIWSDDQGDVWIFGGYGLDSEETIGHLNDLWKFDTQSLEWTWISGSNQADEAGSYGTIDVYNANNIPGGRSASLQWIDSNGIVWIFGGDGIDKFGITNSYLNDLWSYDPQSNQWAWHSGSDFSGSTGSYNETGLSSTEYVPGARWHSNGWVDENDDLWLFGGYKFNQLSTGLYNDFWKYEQSTKEWTWISGFRSTAKVNELGVYGDENQGSKPHPGSRHGGLTWTDDNNDFWLLGGAEIGSSRYGFYNDLWKYSPQKNTWEYINGNTELILNEGVYGSKGIGSDTNEPRSRWHGASWTGSDGKLWFFGGINHNEAIGNIAWINDLWNYDPESNTYTWMGGSKSINANGVYGEKGQSSINHIPGARSSSAYWSDQEGNFWLFGGYESFEYNNDLWKFNPSTLEWTWVSGNNFQNSPGIYGELGVANSANSIGARRYTDGRIDQDGNVWIFGGEAQDSQAQRGFINDLWKYNPTTNMWTWMSGPKLINQAGNYGVKGVSSPENLPPGRYSHSMWIDDAGNVWVFGGYGRKDVDSSVGNLNDFWKFDVKTNEWTWMGGSDEVGNDGVFGAQTQFSESNIIPSKARALTFQTYDKSLWLFGGRNGPSFNDFWEIKFTPETPFVQTPSTIKQDGFTFSYDEAWAREFRLQISLLDDLSDVFFDEKSDEKSKTVENLSPGTQYYYRLDAVNEIGNSGFGSTQQVLTLPATPEFESSELAITDLTSTSANLNWIVTPGILDGYLIDISRDADFSDESMIHEDYNAKEISVSQLQEVTGLRPGTEYYAKLRSSNASGTSPYSVTVPFLTRPEVPTFETETVVTNFTQTSVTLNWNQVPEILSGYRLTISSLDDDFVDETGFLEDYNSRNVPKDRTFVNISNLEAGTQYYAFLTSINDSGESEKSEKISILTTPASPVFAIEGAVE